MRKSLIIFLFFLPFAVSAQFDAPFTQYHFNQAMHNPAYTGIHGVTSINLVSKIQWVGIEGAPFTNMLNVHSSFLNDRLGGGLLFINDRYGVNNNNEIHLSYSYKIELNNTIISMGLMTGLVSFNYDYGKLNTEGSDPSFIESGESFTQPNFGAGIFVSGSTYFLGVSVPRFMNIEIENGNISSTRYKRHIYLSGGYLFDQVFAFKLKPSFLFRTVDGGFNALDMNLDLLFNERIWVGATMRNLGDAFNLRSSLIVNPNLRIGASFELSSQSFSGANFGSYEIMVSYDLGSVGNRYW